MYAAVNTFLPNLVSSVVLFYGGSLVLTGMVRLALQGAGVT